jgi:hypothetical protein
MKIALFQELLDLNRAFEQVMRGLERPEKVQPLTARVDVNREFFDNFDAVVEDTHRGPTSFSVNTTGKLRTLTMCISISKTPKRGARRRACRPAWRSPWMAYER